jgi:hypothetical protein
MAGNIKADKPTEPEQKAAWLAARDRSMQLNMYLHSWFHMFALNSQQHNFTQSPGWQRARRHRQLPLHLLWRRQAGGFTKTLLPQQRMRQAQQAGLQGGAIV